MRSLLLTVCCFSVFHLDASQVLEVNGQVGGNVSIHCFDSWSAVNISELDSVHFCNGICSAENTIIQMEMMSSSVKWDGRYSMELDGEDGVFTVTINKLKRTDTGSYLCAMSRSLKLMFQEVSLKVVDVSTVPAGSPEAPNTTQQAGLRSPRGSFPSNDEASHVTIMPPSSDRKRRQKEANHLTDTMVVIIISGSLAFLVCAIIPLIFYRRWRNIAGQNKQAENINANDCCQENVNTASTQIAVGVQTSEEDPPKSEAEDNLQYAEVYEGLDPKTLE
ncbi:uncharacterized protein LOC119798045 [Cyprinodon tularosa]|uniref:uncharacterized protein LOC119798045 n=1 Tax=Cyprinodon tularosa TaxID=77115 RepID=UPI0018E280C2|nr:uncharacterized protein LOC119798045 [Cyprinodon tularosa]